MKRLEQPRFLILLLLSASMLAVIGCGKSSQDVGDRKKVKVHMEKEQYGKASDILERLIADYPDDAELHLLHGKCLHELKRHDEAKRAYRKVTELDPGNLEAIVARATIEMEQGIEKKAAERPHAELSQHFYQAHLFCRRALEKSPDNKDVLLVQAKVYFLEDKPDEAIARLDQAIKADPKSADAYLLKAEINAGERNFIEAERACNVIINEIDSKHFRARSALSRIHQQQGEIDQAIAVLADADPSDDDQGTERSQKFELHFRRAELYRDAGELGKALKEADELDNLRKSSPYSSLIRGSVALFKAEKESDITRRDELYRQAVRMLHKPSSQSQHHQWLYFYAQALRGIDRNREAIEAYRAAIKAAPDFASAHLDLGEVYKEDQSDLRQAVTHLTRAIEIFERKREAGKHDAMVMSLLERAYHTRASVYDSLGEPPLAKEDARRCTYIGDLILRATEGAPKALGDGRMLYYRGEFAESIEMARRGIALLPPEKKTKKEQKLFVGLTALIGDAYSGLNKQANAISAYSEAALNAPKRSDIRLQLVRAMLKNGQTEEAEKLLITALDEHADDATIPTALAQLAEMSGKNAEAARYYQQAIERNSRFLPAYSLATLNLEQNETEQAIEVWQLALKENAGHLPALRGLAVALLQKGQYDAAIEAAEKHHGLATGRGGSRTVPTFLPPYFLLACSHACAGQWDKAKQDIRNMSRHGFTENSLIPYDQLLEWAQKRPDNGKKLVLHLLRAAVFVNDLPLLQAKSSEERVPHRRALAELKKAVIIDPNSVLAHDRLSDVYLVTNPDMLLTTTAAIKRIRPDYAGPYLMEGFFARLGRKNKLSAALYAEGIKLDTENATAMVVLGGLLHRLGKYAEAEQWFRRAISRNPKQPRAHSGLGRALLALGRPDEASEEFKKEFKSGRDDYRARSSMFIVRQFNKGEFAKAIKNCLEFRKLWPLDILMYDLQAKCHEGLGQLVEAEQVLEDAVETAPDNIIGYTLLADYYLRRSQPERAIEIIENGIRANADSKELQGKLAIIHAGMGEFDKAGDILDAILKTRPDDIETLMTKASLFWIMARQRDDVTKKEMQENALAIARKVKRETPGPDSLKARLFIAQALQYEGNIDQAIIEYQEALKVEPGHGPIFGRLAILLFSQRRYARAIVVMEDGARYTPKYVKSTQAACRQLEGRYPEALKLLNEEDAGPHVAYLKANVHLAAGQFELATKTLEKKTGGKDYADLVDSCKDKPGGAKEIADGLTSEWIYRAHLWNAKALEAIEAVVKFAPKSIFVLTRKAELQALNGDPRGAVETLKLVDKLAKPKRFSIRLLLGNMTNKLQNFKDSVYWYKQALEIVPAGATKQLRTVRTNLAQVYLATRMYDEAEEQVSKIEQLDSDYLPAFQMKALIYKGRNEKQKELKVYEQMIKKAPDAPLTIAFACNNLAYELATLPQPQMDRAINLAEMAHKRHPRSIMIRDTLGWVYFLAGRTAEAYEHFKQIELNAPRPPSIRYHIGKVFVTYGIGQKEPDTVKRGLKALQKALELDRKFEEEKPCRDAIDKAAKWLEKNGG